MTSILPGVFAGLVRAAFATLAVATLASCGSGAVTDNTPAPTTPITVTPSTATLYSGLPTVFNISGGNGAYIIASSDQSAVPIGGSTTANSFTVVPGPVTTDTSVTLTVRDTAGTQTTAALTVKPRTISNVAAVTPSPTQAAVCGTAVCSGGDAEVSTTLTQNGVPLANRSVRFDVVSGDFRIITSPPGSPETTSLSGTTVTDTTGTARMRIRVATDATAQTGLIQITDVTGGFTQRVSFPIYPVSAAPLTVGPTAIQFVGQNSTTCANGTAADVIVVGGRAPYQVSQPAGFSVFPTILTASGQRFTVSANGTCVTTPQPITVIDQNGTTATVNVSNVVGPVTVTPPTFVASPDEVTLTSCTDVASIALAGGTGNYFAASGSSALTANVVGNTGAIRRTAGTSVTAGTVINVAFSDGRTAVPVEVTISPAAATCP